MEYNCHRSSNFSSLMASNRASAANSRTPTFDPANLGGVFQELVERLTDGVCVFDAAGTVAYSNSALAQMLGYQSNELLGMNLASLIHPDELPTARALLERKQAASSEVVDCRWITKSGSELWTRCNALPFSKASIGFRGAITIVQ